MTTEQMDWLDDERAGRHRWPFTPNPADGVRLNPDEPAPDLDPEQHFGHEEEHTHYTREARDQCAAGDHKYAELLDLAAEREKAVTVKPEDYVTMAEEPREHAERRQWLDGYLAGFREGFERAGR